MDLSQLEKSTVRKVTMRLIPFCFVFRNFDSRPGKYRFCCLANE